MARWCTFAKACDEAFLQCLKVNKKLKQMYLRDNEFISGFGAKLSNQLSGTGKADAVTILAHELALSRSVSARDFKEGCCMPMKMLELWERQINIKCQLANHLLAFARVVQSLKTWPALQKVNN